MAGVLTTLDSAPALRALAAVLFTLSAIASGWWAASLATTWEVDRFPRRLLVHLYAFISLFGVFVLIPFIMRESIHGMWGGIGFILTIGFWVLALQVEGWRIGVEAAKKRALSAN